MIKKISSRIRIILLVNNCTVLEARRYLRDLPLQGCHDKQDGIERLFIWIDVVLKSLPKLDMLRAQLGTIKSQIKTIERNKEGLRYIIDAMPETINRLQPLDKFIRGILLQLNGFIDADSSFFSTVDDNNELVLLVGTGVFDGDERAFHAKINESIYSNPISAVRSSKEAIIEDHKVYLPLCSKDDVIGIFYLEKNDTELKDLEIEMLRLFASQAAVTIENSNLFKLATLDGLTGLFVRRYFLQRFQEVLQFASRFGGQSISLLMFDIDHFKYVNDTFGHAAGDSVLSSVSDVIKSSIRATDVAGRLGGEEFALLLVDTDIDEAVKIAEEIREKVKAMKFDMSGTEHFVTISIGVSNYSAYTISSASLANKPLNDVVKHDVKEMLVSADKALYFSKENGRDRVTVADSVSERE